MLYLLKKQEFNWILFTHILTKRFSFFLWANCTDLLLYCNTKRIYILFVYWFHRWSVFPITRVRKKNKINRHRLSRVATYLWSERDRPRDVTTGVKHRDFTGPGPLMWLGIFFCAVMPSGEGIYSNISNREGPLYSLDVAVTALG